MGWPVVTLILGCVWAFIAFIAVLAKTVKTNNTYTYTDPSFKKISLDD